MLKFISKLFAAKTIGSSRTQNRSSLHVEALEERSCPAVTWFTTATTAGTVLNITSDAAHDTVYVDQDDVANKLRVSKDNVNWTSYTSSSIAKVAISMGDGDDHVVYRTEGSAILFNKKVDIKLGNGSNEIDIDTVKGSRGSFGKVHSAFDMIVTGGGQKDDLQATLAGTYNGKMTFVANLGSGNDVADVDLKGGAEGSGAVTKVELNGQAGNDNLLSKAYFSPETGYGIKVAAGCRLDLITNGGVGDDTLRSWYWGEVDGTLNFKVDGNKNSDASPTKSTVTSPTLTPADDDSQVSGELMIYSGSTGSVTGKVLGGTGDDRLTFTVTNNGAPSALSLLLDGGLDYDLWHVSSNVAAVNCEGYFPFLLIPIDI